MTLDSLVHQFMEYVGASFGSMNTFPQLFSWIMTVLVAVEFVLFALDGIFYAVRSIARGIK